MKQKIAQLLLNRLVFCQNNFKANLVAGNIKKKRVLDMIAVKCQFPLKKYFTKYHRTVRQQKRD